MFFSWVYHKDMDLYGMHEGLAQANAISSQQASYNQDVSDENVKAVKDLKTHQTQEKEGDDIGDVKDGVANAITGFTVHKSAKAYKDINAKAVSKGAEAEKGVKGGALAGEESTPMIKVLKSHKFTPSELRGGAGGQMGRRTQYLKDGDRMKAAGLSDDTDPAKARGVLSGPTDEQEQAFKQKSKASGGASGEGDTDANHPSSDSAPPKKTTDTTSLKDPADKPSSTGGGAKGTVGAIEEGGDEAKTGAGSFIKKATGMGGKIADGVGKVAGGLASGGMLAQGIYGEVESFKNHPGGSLWSKMQGDNWEQKVGNVSQDIGTAMDLVGTFVPGAQVLGLVGTGISAVGGLLDDVGDAVEHHKKEQKTKAEVEDPSKAGVTHALGTVSNLASGGGIAQAQMSTLRQVQGQA